MHHRVYSTRTFHSENYYFSLLTTLINGINSKLTNAQLAEALNGCAILSPIGKPWTATAVRLALHKLRHHRDIPSNLHRALLQLVFDGRLNAPDTYVLFEKQQDKVM